MKIFEVETEEDFKEKVLSASKPVVVDFYAKCVSLLPCLLPCRIYIHP